MKKDKLKKIIVAAVFIIIICISHYINIGKENKDNNVLDNKINTYEISSIPSYSGEIYVVINNNIPKFVEEDINIEEDYYSAIRDEKVRNSYGKNKLEKSKCR